MLIIAVLVGQIIVSTLFFGNGIFGKIMILSFFALFFSFFGLVFINKEIQQKEKYRKSDIKNLKFKRNYDIFKQELLQQDKVDFQHTAIFKLGNPQAKLHISLVSNPYCGYCKDAHKILEKLLNKYPEDVSAQIRFNYFVDEKSETYKTLISDFSEIYQQETQWQFLESINFWLENKNIDSFRKRYNPNFSENVDLHEVITTGEENKKLGFTFTPMFFINGYVFPNRYDREDIFYFIDDLLEDEEIINKKAVAEKLRE